MKLRHPGPPFPRGTTMEEAAGALANSLHLPIPVHTLTLALGTRDGEISRPSSARWSPSARSIHPTSPRPCSQCSRSTTQRTKEERVKHDERVLEVAMMNQRIAMSDLSLCFDLLRLEKAEK